MSARNLQVYYIDTDELLDLLAALGAPVPAGARTVGLQVSYYAGVELVAEHPDLQPVPPRTVPAVRRLQLQPLLEALMEKQGVIRPGLTPPEGKGPEKTASAEELEGHVTKRAADAAEAAHDEPQAPEGSE